MAQTIKNLPAIQETQVRSPGQEDPLEKGMSNHSITLVWRIHGHEPRGLQPMGSKRPTAFVCHILNSTFKGYLRVFVFL